MLSYQSLSLALGCAAVCVCNAVAAGSDRTTEDERGRQGERLILEVRAGVTGVRVAHALAVRKLTATHAHTAD